MILKSRKKLSTPYRRLIFCLSWFDMCYSLGSMLSFLPAPAAEHKWGSIGNRRTCSAQGFIIFLGVTGGPLYNLGLCIFYLSVVVFSITTRKFVMYVEPLLHIFPIPYSFTIGIFLWVKGYYNAGPDYSVCWVSPYPTQCLTDSTVPCERGEKAVTYRWLFIAYPITFVFLVIITTMSLIIWRVWKQEKSVESYRFKQLAMRRSLRESNFAFPSDSTFQQEEEDSRRQNNRQSIFPFRRSRKFSGTGRRLSLMIKQSKKNKEVMLQAFCYVLCYVVTWILPYTNQTMEGMKMKVPYALRLTSRFINPGQGILNILVYTRPHVNSLRRAYPEYSWLKAFTIVVKSGGDNDGIVRKRRQ